MREDVALKQSGSNSRNGEKRTDSGYILEVKQAGLTDGLDVENAEKREIRDDCWIKLRLVKQEWGAGLKGGS